MRSARARNTASILRAMSNSTSRLRSIATVVLIGLTCILTFVSVLTVWMRALVLNTDSYVKAVGPLIDNPAVRAEVARDVVDALYEREDVPGILRDALPEKARVIAPTLAQGIHDTAIQLAEAALATDAVRKVWNEANRVAHEQVVHLLKGEGKLVTTDQGEVAIDLRPIVTQVRQALDDHGVQIFDQVPVSQIDRRFVLYRSHDLARAQNATKLLDTLGIWLPVAAVLTGIGAIACSRHRRRTVGHLCIVIAATMVVLMVGIAIGRAFYLDHVGSVPRDVAAAPFDGLVRSLRFWVRTIFVVAIGGWFVTWFAGSRELVAREREVRVALGSVVRDHSPVLAGVGAVAAALVLIVWDQPSPRAVLFVLLVLALWEVGLRLLAREPAAPRPAQPA
jgi:hypothetical protein